jgi:hypothetical protein
MKEAEDIFVGNTYWKLITDLQERDKSVFWSMPFIKGHLILYINSNENLSGR